LKALVTGAGGQVARALDALRPEGVQLTALGHAELDIGDAAAVEGAVAMQRPDLIINAAAYTAVDKAESEPALAARVNGEGPGYLAAAARKHGARLLHISTDFVFDGTQSRPYVPADAPRPLGALPTACWTVQPLQRPWS
jgi:dTDP-4-dehydrorhamnose reductase